MWIKEYRRINNLCGWVVFTIALVVYLMTIEPTASFWDCSEYIASAYKLEVCHPPGAPFFMLIANLVSHFVCNPDQVAKAVNTLSAVLSAFTILFLFWTITRFSGKLVLTETKKKYHFSQLISIIGAGLTGALAYTFSDTFWFSAVEGEVYAFSSFMTAIVFWLILKWEDVAEEPYSDRWLILISYLIGISIGIHLLNLLCIPAIALVYFFRKNSNPTRKKIYEIILISFGIVAAILFGLVQGLVKIAGWFELFFVNILRLPYNSGAIFYSIFILTVLSWAIWKTMHVYDFKDFKKAKLAFILSIILLGIPFIGNGWGLWVLIIVALSVYLFFSKKINPIDLNTTLLAFLVMVIGYSSYVLVIIRSTSNTPMDENSPDNIFTLRSYLAREQYGETPLLYGQTFVSEPKYENKNGVLEAVTKDEGAIWSPIIKKKSHEKDRYYESGRKKQYVYVDELNTFFPRMYSSSPYHVQGYKEWSNFQGKQIEINSIQGGRSKWVLKPTFGENLMYFFRYQVNFMYWRYFLWNFSGRQNDIQSYGGISNGNWITGIKWIDQLRLGPQDDMPDSIVKNKGHNKFYMLPLLLGLCGIFFQKKNKKKGREQLWIIFLFFFMTGLAIVLYLNQPPFQPRERDYAYVGSFYAFCIWIGIGTLAVVEKLQSFKKFSNGISSAIGVILCLLVPVQMVSQTWDDHDRSGRFIVRDFAKNYLSTCEKNAVIFTNGDNETFPLWYIQEVEGFRTDIRVCNLSYLQTDWYIDQMKRQAYESQPLPIDWTKQEYIQYKHDAAYIFDLLKKPISIEIALNRIKSDNYMDKQLPGYNFEIDYIPSNKILIPVDSTAVIASGIVKLSNAAWIPHYILIDLSNQPNEKGVPTIQEKRILYKDEIMILDILKNNLDWKRPIYYSVTTGPDKYLRLFPYFRCDGIAYRIMPFKASEYQPVDVNIMYDNVMNKYCWGNLEKPDLYLDENALRMILTFRIIFGQLASQLIIEKDYNRAKKVLDKCLKVIPSYNVPYDYYSVSPLADAYFKIGCKHKADQLYTELVEKYIKDLKWYNRLKNDQYVSSLEHIQEEIYFIRKILYFFEKNHPEIIKKYRVDFYTIIERFRGVVENKTII